MEFSKISKTLSKKIKKEDKKKQGIYFTPQSIIQKNLDILNDYFENIKNILEPSCGTGEYISVINDLYPDISVTGIEYNKQIYDSIKDDFPNILNQDFINFEIEQKYDLIIGNPPFYVIKKKDYIFDDSYREYFTGRANIFILFIIKSLKLLNENGILSFILPYNFLNCLYYDKTRGYIFKNFQILNIQLIKEKKYIDTQQPTMIFILQKKSTIDNSAFKVNTNRFTILSTPENTKTLNELYQNSSTLGDLGFNVGVGNVVWNEIKEYLTSDNQQIRLFYSNDIFNKKLIKSKIPEVFFSDSSINKGKKHFIDYESYCKKNESKVKSKEELLLILNRGYGKGDYKFEYSVIDLDYDYCIENHLIMIDTIEKFSKREKQKKYDLLIKSMENEKTQKFVNLYFCNSAINTTELLHILPIYI